MDLTSEQLETLFKALADKIKTLELDLIVKDIEIDNLKAENRALKEGENE